MRLDMRELLEREAAGAGDPPMRHSTDDFVAGGRRRQTRRRLTWATSAATAVLGVAAATVVPQMIAGEKDAPVSDQAVMLYPVTAFGYTLTGYTVGDIEISDPVNVTPGYQQSRIRRSGETSRYERGDGTFEQVPVSRSVLTVYRAGVFNPVRFQDGEQVPVGTATGLYSAGEAALAWPYDPGAWAVIRSALGHLGRADMIRVAEAMRTGRSRPAALPWRMTYLPAGYHLSSMGTAADDELVGNHLQQGDARFTREPEEYSDLTQPLIGDGLANLRVQVYPRWVGESRMAGHDWLSGPSGEPSGTPSYWPTFEPSMWPSHPGSADPSYALTPGVDPFCVPGRSICFRGTADGAYVIEATATAESGAELKQVLRGMRLDDPGDETTWSDLGDALPATGR
jgi:hypothetical protein